MPTKVSKFGKGALPDLEDSRDFPAEALMGSVDLPLEYSLRNHITIKDQGSTSSCVGQAAAQYAQVLNIVEEGKLTELSARDIYSRIYVPQGGAYLRDGVKAVVDQGVVTENDAPSYPRKETFFRTRDDITPEEVENGKKYKGKSYALLPINVKSLFMQAIYQHHGVLMGAVMSNAGWRNAEVRPPKSGEALTGHAVYGCGWKVVNGEVKIEIANSWGDWGDDGFGFIGQDYFDSYMLFSPWTLIDQSNTPDPDEPDSYRFTRDLYYGLFGDDVLELQKYMNRKGFIVAQSGPGSPGNETKYYGWLTRAAVAKWQTYYSVWPPYGYFGPLSRSKYEKLEGLN